MAVGRYHIIIDLKNVPQKVLTNKGGLKEFLRELPEKIEMNILAGPTVVAGIPQNPGLSGFVLIDYSHISVHTFNQYAQALVDIFSCKPYDQNLAREEVLKYFQVEPGEAKIQQISWD